MGQTPILLAEGAGEEGAGTRRDRRRSTRRSRLFRCRRDSRASLARRHRPAHRIRQDRVHGHRPVRPGGSGVAVGFRATHHRAATHLLRGRPKGDRRRSVRTGEAVGKEAGAGQGRHREVGRGRPATDCIRRTRRVRGRAVPGRTSPGCPRAARRHVSIGSLGTQPSPANPRRIDGGSDRLAAAVPRLRTQIDHVADLRGTRRQRQPRAARRSALCAALPPDLARRPAIRGREVGREAVAALLLPRGDVRDPAAGDGRRLPGHVRRRAQPLPPARPPAVGPQARQVADGFECERRRGCDRARESTDRDRVESSERRPERPSSCSPIEWRPPARPIGG